MNGEAQRKTISGLTARQVVANSAIAIRQASSAMAELEALLWSQPQSFAVAHSCVQQIDTISQTLVELEGTFERLSDGMDSDDFIDTATVIDPVRLEKLRVLLTGEASRKEPTDSLQQNRAIQLFD